MKKRFSVSSIKHGKEKLKEVLEDPNSMIQELTIDIHNDKITASTPVTNEGWNNSLLDDIWNQARKSNADFIAFSMIEAHKAGKWSCRISMWGPERLKGWRKITYRFGNWLSCL